MSMRFPKREHRKEKAKKKMDGIKLSIKALAAVKGMTIKELADASGISQTHLKDISCGRVRMTADDLIKLSKATEIPMENIQP